MNRATKYVIFEIAIWIPKTKRTDYREYAVTVFDDPSGDKMALDGAKAYAQSCASRYGAGSTYTIKQIGLEEERP